MAPYVAEVHLVVLDLFDIWGFVGCVDLVLVLVVQLTIQTLRIEKQTTCQRLTSERFESVASAEG